MPGKESITPAEGKDPERDYPFLKMEHLFLFGLTCVLVLHYT